jgi:hypothetical protein
VGWTRSVPGGGEGFKDGGYNLGRHKRKLAAPLSVDRCGCELGRGGSQEGREGGGRWWGGNNLVFQWWAPIAYMLSPGPPHPQLIEALLD